MATDYEAAHCLGPSLLYQQWRDANQSKHVWQVRHDGQDLSWANTQMIS